jgi:hypothetical protein
MSVKQSLNTIIDAYEEGLIPSGLYYPGPGNAPLMHHPTVEKISGSEDDSHVHVKKNSSMRKLLDTFKMFRTVFNVDGSFNPKSSIAESYAISLALEEKYSASVKMFDAITAKGFELLVKNNGAVLPVINKFGMLGFEGVLQYADACLETGNNDRAKILYGTIANLPRKCYGAIRYGDVRIAALETLVNTFGMKGYRSSLELAKKLQY